MDANKTEYIEYKALKPFEDKSDFVKITNSINQGILEPKDWRQTFESIDILRRLNKFNKRLFNKTFNSLINEIPALIESLESKIRKNLLILLLETFEEFEFETKANWTKTLIPFIINRSILDKQFIKDVCIKTLNTISENMFYEETCLSFLTQILNANIKISESATNLLINFIDAIEINYFYFKFDWDAIIKRLIDIYKRKADSYVKKAFKIINKLKEKFGEDRYETIIKTKISDDTRKKFSELKDYNSKHKPTNDLRFKDYMKNKKVN